MSYTWERFQEAEFFLRRIAEFQTIENNENLITRVLTDLLSESDENGENIFSLFRYYLSAFLSAYRSVTWVMKHEFADVEGFDTWYNKEVRPRLVADSKQKLLVELRNTSLKEALIATPSETNVKTAESQISGSVKWFIETDVIKSNNKIAKIPNINEIVEVDIATICQQCMNEMREIVFNCGERFSK